MTTFSRRALLTAGAGLTAACAAPKVRDKGRVASATDEWAAVRAEFRLDPDYVHMAGLLLASHPTPVREAIARHREGLDRNPVKYLQETYERSETDARAAAAAYVGGVPEEIGLTDSTTMGLGMVYNGIHVAASQELLTTEHDHYSTHESLALKAKKSKASVRRVALYEKSEAATAEGMVSALKAAIRDETRVVAVTWVHSSTGVKLPIAALAAVVAEANQGRSPEKRALFCVDGVHGFGVEEIDVRKMGCDFFVAGTHKWLFGPRGTGIIWGRKESWPVVDPTIPSFNIEWLVSKMQGKARPELPWGKRVTPGGFHSFEHRWALGEAFRFHEKIGPAKITARIHALNTQLKQGLAANPKVKLHTPMDPTVSSGITCFSVDGMAPGPVVKKLMAQKIVCGQTPYFPTYVRFTPGLLNDPSEVDRTVAAVRTVTA